MQLAAWLKKEGKTGTDLANEIGVDVSTINRLIPKPGKKQKRRPSLDLAAKIKAATGGEVTADDLMVVSPASGVAEVNAVQTGNPSRDRAA
jgi:transcriptional regulator with XRE-family HTH domain